MRQRKPQSPTRFSRIDLLTPLGAAQLSFRNQADGGFPYFGHPAPPIVRAQTSRRFGGTKRFSHPAFASQSLQAYLNLWARRLHNGEVQ